MQTTEALTCTSPILCYVLSYTPLSAYRSHTPSYANRVGHVCTMWLQQAHCRSLTKTMVYPPPIVSQHSRGRLVMLLLLQQPKSGTDQSQLPRRQSLAPTQNAYRLSSLVPPPNSPQLVAMATDSSLLNIHVKLFGAAVWMLSILWLSSSLFNRFTFIDFFYILTISQMTSAHLHCKKSKLHLFAPIIYMRALFVLFEPAGSW